MYGVPLPKPCFTKFLQLNHDSPIDIRDGFNFANSLLNDDSNRIQTGKITAALRKRMRSLHEEEN